MRERYIIQKPVKQEKHDVVKLPTQIILDYKTDIISQAIKDEISHRLSFMKLFQKKKNIANVRSL